MHRMIMKQQCVGAGYRLHLIDSVLLGFVEHVKAVQPTSLLLLFLYIW